MSVLYLKSLKGFPLLNLQQNPTPFLESTISCNTWPLLLIPAFYISTFYSVHYDPATLAFFALVKYNKLIPTNFHLRASVPEIFWAICLECSGFTFFAQLCSLSYSVSPLSFSLNLFLSFRSQFKYFFFRELFPDDLNYSTLQTRQSSIISLYFIFFRPLHVL